MNIDDLLHAFRAGHAGAPNPYIDERGWMPANLRGAALWHAYEAGRCKAAGNLRGAMTRWQGARFCAEAVK